MSKLIVKDDKMYLDERELPPLPHRKKFLNPVVIEDGIYVNGYELCNNEWKRTLKAWLCQFIGWWF